MVGNGEEGKFKAGGDTGFIEDVGEMAFDGFFAECELFGDVAVGAAFDDAAHDFEFTRSEPVSLALWYDGLLHEVVQGGNQVDDAFAADPVIAAIDGANRCLQVAGKGIFEHNAASADVQGFNDLLGGDG